MVWCFCHIKWLIEKFSKPNEECWDDYFCSAQMCRKCGNVGKDHKPRVLFGEEVIYKIHKAEKALPHIKSLVQVYR